MRSDRCPDGDMWVAEAEAERDRPDAQRNGPPWLMRASRGRRFMRTRPGRATTQRVAPSGNRRASATAGSTGAGAAAGARGDAPPQPASSESVVTTSARVGTIP